MTKTITSKEAAKILGYSVGHVTTHLLQTGKIKATKVNGKWQVDLESARAYVPPVINKGRIIPTKKDIGSKEENRAVIQEQMEAVRSGRLKPLILERGISLI